MPRISKVTDTFTKLEYGYLYDIQRYTELLDWYSVVTVEERRRIFRRLAEPRGRKPIRRPRHKRGRTCDDGENSRHKFGRCLSKTEL